MNQPFRQPWLYHAGADLLFIIAPPFFCLGLIALFPEAFAGEGLLPEWGWVILVLGIDVSHVYSTLFRTYFDHRIYTEQRTRLILIPLLAFIGGVLLYSFSQLVFWRALAYLAVYHFVRQQYGFMRLYARKEGTRKWERIIDQAAIYTATLYPLLYWHLEGNRRFHWFIEGDFLTTQAPDLLGTLTVAYAIVMSIYLVKEGKLILERRTFNIPRNGIMLGTALSWYFGIVHFNGDISFTLLNVVSHGIPYIALVWIAGRRGQDRTGAGEQALVPAGAQLRSWIMRHAFTWKGLILFLGCILVFAFVEEALWDAWVWQEHRAVFPALNAGGAVPSREWLSLIVPALAVPQITHYVIDGYIWKISKGHVPAG